MESLLQNVAKLQMDGAKFKAELKATWAEVCTVILPKV